MFCHNIPYWHRRCNL